MGMLQARRTGFMVMKALVPSSSGISTPSAATNVHPVTAGCLTPAGAQMVH